MRRVRPTFFTFLFSLSLCNSSLAQPHVMASIKPIQLIAQEILGTRSEVSALMPAGATPHHFSLRPSDFKRLGAADVFIWLGDQSEPYLKSAVARLSGEQRVIDLEPQLERDEQGHLDPHLWLSSEKAIAIAQRITQLLEALDPQYATVYQENLQAFEVRARAQRQELSEKLGLLTISYLVYHDAYRYFEQEYGLVATDVVTANPEIKPGAKKILALKKRIADGEVACLIAEPESNAALLKMLAGSSNFKVLVADPMASDIEAGEGAYFQMLYRLSDLFVRCR